MEIAIERAIKAGWYPKQNTGEFHHLFEEKAHLEVFYRDYFLLDPEFWRCLGKAEGWGIEPSGSIWQGEPQWKIYWHRFIDALSEGQTPDQFFTELLTK